MGRGIAAVMDAIFLLLIAAIASGIILSAAASYGKNFQEQSSKLLLNYYAKQVVRTIVTASIEREGVPDYLLSFIKENVENFKELGAAEEKMEEVVRKAMGPLSARYDYAVMLDARDTSWDTVYLFYKVTDGERTYEGVCVYEKDRIRELDEWLYDLGPTVYSSTTTIFLRFCPAETCYYIPTDIRVVIFPLGSTETPCSFT